MPTIVQKYIDTCETCQLQKTPKKGNGYLKPVKIGKFQFLAHLQHDLIGRLPESNENRFALIGIDKATKFRFAKACTSPNSEVI